ncbi:cytochrome P450 [Xylaria bambusicola]|uniref:cytochrome P450 n=1 Tax=Xylaria bambusicola TaxID=326684 RepID=UPI002007C116|nr:cytochrome P450 [Xylaria bambusicola]KAI0517176.1 cytochrome P450 [Xylaria bambusicola]
MVSSILLVTGAVVAWWAFKIINGLRTNIARAKSTGLPYHVVPVNPINNIAQIFAFIWVPLWKFLVPKKYWEDIAEVCEHNWQFKKRFAPFAKMGDNILIVTPFTLTMHTASPEIIADITSRREDFPKPLEHYAILSMFGRNIVTTEGALWRMHRKVTSPSFNEKNSALVFRDAIGQAQGMTDHWLRTQKDGSFQTVEHDTMSMALNIISYVGFGLRLVWPGQPLPVNADSKMARYASFEPPEGHSLTFAESIGGLLHHLLVLLLTPSIILNNHPSKMFKEAKIAKENYELYMKEFLQQKVKDVRRGDRDVGMDIMGSLVATSYQDKQDGNKAGIQLDDSEIIGNAFIMFLAGHETTANVMHFTMLELANNPAAQRRLQQDIDAILGRNTDPATWNYEEKVGAMQASMIGAVMNETLRVMPPVVEVPKKTPPTKEQTITIDGVRRALPPNTYLGLCVVACQRNPRAWPGRPSKITGAPDDLDDWVPERWFRPSIGGDEKQSSGEPETEDFGGYAGPDTSASMFRPVRGSFIPFSEGPRACLGRRLAIVEVLGAVAAIFQKYSIENAVEDWASDEEVARMNQSQKDALYRKAVKRSRDVIASSEARITLKLHNGARIPLRLVKRGEERFVNWYEE